MLFVSVLLIAFVGWCIWLFVRQASAAATPLLKPQPYDPKETRRAQGLRERFDNPYYYSGMSDYSGTNDLDQEIAELRDQYREWGPYETQKQRHDRLWIIAQLKDQKQKLQHQWAAIDARMKAEQADREARLPALRAAEAERERLAKLAQEQAAREAAERAEQEKRAYREAIARAASQDPNEAP
jgi:hypothetical protein